MEENGNKCDPWDIAEDLKNYVDEVSTVTEMTLNETRPEDFIGADWDCLREAVKEARKTLREMLEKIDRKQTEADEYEPEDDEVRYATYWDLI